MHHSLEGLAGSHSRHPAIDAETVHGRKSRKPMEAAPTSVIIRREKFIVNSIFRAEYISRRRAGSAKKTREIGKEGRAWPAAA